MNTSLIYTKVRTLLSTCLFFVFCATVGIVKGQVTDSSGNEAIHSYVRLYLPEYEDLHPLINFASISNTDFDIFGTITLVANKLGERTPLTTAEASLLCGTLPSNSYVYPDTLLTQLDFRMLNDTLFRLFPPYLSPVEAYKRPAVYDYLSELLTVPLQGIEDTVFLTEITQWLGTPYVYGAMSRRGTDCSGFVYAVYQDVYGITLTHAGAYLLNYVQEVPRADMLLGDIVFFAYQGSTYVFHVGIYLGNNKFVHASRRGVLVSDLDENFYQGKFYKGGRVTR